jgi:hypothetical protein
MNRRSVLRLVKSEPPPDKAFVADYTHWWRLPRPLPPRRFPLGLLLVLVAVAVLSLCLCGARGRWRADGAARPLRYRCATFYAMNRAYWQKELREAESELDAATTLKAAAKRLQRAKAELKQLEGEPAKSAKRSSRGGAAEGASS